MIKYLSTYASLYVYVIKEVIVSWLVFCVPLSNNTAIILRKKRKKFVSHTRVHAHTIELATN